LAATHDVLNQSTPFVTANLFAIAPALPGSSSRDNGAEGARAELIAWAVPFG